MRCQVGHQRGPGRRAHAATVHEDERRAVARLENPDSNRRVCEAHAPTRELDATRFKQPTLGLLKRQRRLILYVGHRSVPFASLLVVEMIPDMDGFGVAHRISAAEGPAWRRTEDSQGRHPRVLLPSPKRPVRESRHAAAGLLLWFLGLSWVGMSARAMIGVWAAVRDPYLISLERDVAK